MPKISVITVAYNAQNSIERTIKSVINQSFEDFEYILVDGNSNDKTLEIAGKYKDYIKKWISEPDKSIYDAMNKGILLSQGEYIVFLNANDAFATTDMLEKMSKYLDGTDIVYGNVGLINLCMEKQIIRKAKKINKKSLFQKNILLPSEFIKREFLENMGGFDTRFKYEADYELNLRAILKDNAKIKYVDEIITLATVDNDKLLSPKRMRRIQKEKMVIKKTYFSPFEKWIYGIFEIFN